MNKYNFSEGSTVYLANSKSNFVYVSVTDQNAVEDGGSIIKDRINTGDNIYNLLEAISKNRAKLVIGEHGMVSVTALEEIASS